MYARGWMDLDSLLLVIRYPGDGIETRSYENVYIITRRLSTCLWSSGRQCRFSTILVTFEFCWKSRQAYRLMLHFVAALGLCQLPDQGIFYPSLGAEFRPNSQSKIATFFSQYHVCFSQLRKVKKKTHIRIILKHLCLSGMVGIIQSKNYLILRIYFATLHMFSRSVFPNFGQGPLIAGKSPALPYLSPVRLSPVGDIRRV